MHAINPQILKANNHIGPNIIQPTPKFIQKITKVRAKLRKLVSAQIVRTLKTMTVNSKSYCPVSTSRSVGV